MGSDFEDDFPTVDLPAGDLSVTANEPSAASNMLSEFVDAAPALASIREEAPEGAKQRRARRHRAEDGLPMPRMHAVEP